MNRTKKYGAVLLILTAFTGILAACGTREDRVELTISAAASLKDALLEVQELYAAKAPSVALSFNFGASGALQRQIEQGAPADLFLSAASKNMKALVEKKLVKPDRQHSLLLNELVVIVPKDGHIAIGSIEDLTKAEIKHVGIGIPESVPAGSYAKEALVSADLWDKLQGKIVQAKDVRQVLQYVETGNADAGFVYRTDALTSVQAVTAFAVDPDSYSAVEYPAGIVDTTKHRKEAEAFYAFLRSEEALAVFTKYGFTIPA